MIFKLYKNQSIRCLINGLFCKALFVHIPKAAGNAIIPICRENRIEVIGHDIRSTDYFSLENHISKLPFLKHKFVFTFVRNPWDRVVSAFFFLNQGGINEYDSKDAEKYIKSYNSRFDRFLKNAFKDRMILNQLHFRPQYQWIVDKNEKLIPDLIGRYENLQHDFDEICRKLGIPLENLQLKNVSNHRHYSKYYDDQTKEIIYDVYKKDIELFNYNF